MMAETAVRNIVIVGGGTAGWMTAAALSRFLGDSYNITLIESDEIGTVGVGEATIPQIRLFNAGLGIDETEFVRATQGSFKLGIEFVDWLRPGERYIHAFGGIGRGLGLLPFHQYWLRHHAKAGEYSLWDFSPNALAAAQNRFSPIEDQPGRPPSGVAYAYHFDAGLYAAFLRRYAEARGVTRFEGQVVDVVLQGETGYISAIKLASGAVVEGDFFIDCSGFRGLLIEQALGSGYEDWSHWLPVDRALAVPCASVEPLTPYTRSTAREAGWQWRIPLQHRTGNGYVYSSKYIDAERATRTLLDNLDGEMLAEPRHLRFLTGKRRKIWKKNCVAIGLASGFLEPLESTSIHLIQNCIARLLSLFPTKNFDLADVAEFNRQADFEFTAIRDFIILHYRANEREGALWKYCQEMAIPDSLQQKIDLFKANGHIFRFNEELFTELGWLQVMWGQGLRPRGYHPLADQLAPDQLAEFLDLAHRHATHVAGQMSDHAAFIARYCAALQENQGRVAL
ncbi:MAG: tryptophan halogenase family protein [Sphingorhabdus sp.]